MKLEFQTKMVLENELTFLKNLKSIYEEAKENKNFNIFEFWIDDEIDRIKYMIED